MGGFFVMIGAKLPAAAVAYLNSELIGVEWNADSPGIYEVAKKLAGLTSDQGGKLFASDSSHWEDRKLSSAWNKATTMKEARLVAADYLDAIADGKAEV